MIHKKVEFNMLNWLSLSERLCWYSLKAYCDTGLHFNYLMFNCCSSGSLSKLTYLIQLAISNFWSIQHNSNARSKVLTCSHFDVVRLSIFFRIYDRPYIASQFNIVIFMNKNWAAYNFLLHLFIRLFKISFNTDDSKIFGSAYYNISILVLHI